MKHVRSFRLSEKATVRLRALSERWELSESTVVEQLIKQAAVDEDIKVPMRQTSARKETREGSSSPKVRPYSARGWM